MEKPHVLYFSPLEVPRYGASRCALRQREGLREGRGCPGPSGPRGVWDTSSCRDRVNREGPAHVLCERRKAGRENSPAVYEKEGRGEARLYSCNAVGRRSPRQQPLEAGAGGICVWAHV